jgi:dephospho-CoA kinase
VAARFGPSVLLADGALDRAALGRLVFDDPAARADLEAIVHPHVYGCIRDWFAQLPAGTRVGIADIPLLFETGREADFDRVIVCACAPEEQIRRIMARDHLDEPAARARLAAQWPIERKVARADFVIRTDGAFEQTDAQVAAIAEVLCG